LETGRLTLLNEYTSKLIRQYVRKKSVFDISNDKYITDTQRQTNRRLRE